MVPNSEISTTGPHQISFYLLYDGLGVLTEFAKEFVVLEGRHPRGYTQDQRR